jgi:hypothetical protein
VYPVIRVNAAFTYRMVGARPTVPVVETTIASRTCAAAAP